MTFKSRIVKLFLFLYGLAMICMEEIFISQNEEQRKQEEQLQWKHTDHFLTDNLCLPFCKTETFKSHVFCLSFSLCLWLSLFKPLYFFNFLLQFHCWNLASLFQTTFPASKSRNTFCTPSHSVMMKHLWDQTWLLIANTSCCYQETWGLSRWDVADFSIVL